LKSLFEDENLLLKDVLNPIILQHAYQQLLHGHLRNGVLDSFIAVFDLIRERTGLDLDGAELVGRAFSLSDPMLIVSDLSTESGRSDQKGFIQMLQGAYLSVRNPKAHSLKTDLNTESAAQYLVFASLLARRIDGSKLGNFLRFDGLYGEVEDDKIGKKYIRFFEDGEVLVYATAKSVVDVPQIMSWLTKENVPANDYPRGTFTCDGKQLKFSTRSKYGEVKYEGEIDGETLTLRIHSLINQNRSRSTFIFEGRFAGGL
jgi:uncharacterized protein (TIGR02391 family)